jgi:hypothetical protein
LRSSSWYRSRALSSLLIANWSKADMEFCFMGFTVWFNRGSNTLTRDSPVNVIPEVGLWSLGARWQQVALSSEERARVKYPALFPAVWPEWFCS